MQRPSPQHFHWPDLDVDLALDSLDAPERYPLVSRLLPRARTAIARERRAGYKAKRRKKL